VQYIDGEGNIIVPKSVRPIIDYKETALGIRTEPKDSFGMEICIFENMMIIIPFIGIK
jgi:hypothetical protein